MRGDTTALNISVDPRAQRMRGTTAHGNRDFDVPYISHIEGNLWTGGCENGLVLPPTIKHLVSLVPWWAYTIEHEIGSALVVRMYDSLDQSFKQVDEIARWVNSCLADSATLVHCQAGLNRSALVAGRALILGGMEPVKAIALLREKRSDAVLCNPSFEDWLLGDAA